MIIKLNFIHLSNSFNDDLYSHGQEKIIKDIFLLIDINYSFVLKNLGFEKKLQKKELMIGFTIVVII